INASLEQPECHRVAKQVDGDSFSLEGGADAGGVCDLLGEHVLNAVNTQPLALHVREEQSSTATLRLAEPNLQDGYRGLCQGGAALLAALPDHANMSARSKDQVSRVAAVISERRRPVCTAVRMKAWSRRPIHVR